jgi:hypothetical protein
MRYAQSYGDSVRTTQDLQRTGAVDLARAQMKLGRSINLENYDSPEVQRVLNETQGMIRAMGQKRAVSSRMQRTSVIGGGGGSPMGGDALNAIPRFYDPLEYWDLSGLPWNVADEGHRHKLHKWLRLYYATHYLVPQLVDIFTRFPLAGLELQHEDPALRRVYDDIFLDQLQYEDFLVSLGREVWLVGEAFPLGSFDENLGIWKHEELINPEDVVIDNFPLLDSQQLKIVPPDYLRRIAQTKQPAREYYLLQQQYPELMPYLLKGEHIPMSPVILRQVANKMNDWDDHGTPILLRGLRTLLHEEKLLASQDAIAERLYSPFLLAKLGIMDMGDGLPPWLPTPEELESVRDDIDIAMASDFRVMVHHFGLEMESVFGREQMPRLGEDFDRIERRLMQVFGVNPSLLSAGSNSQPYASSALQAEFMNQVMRTFQKQLKTHFHERAMVIAEAQGHYAYERKGQTRVEVYETVMEPDEDGELVPVRKRKFTAPELNFATFDLRDEATERKFMQELRAMGVPIPDEKLMIGISWKDEDYTKIFNDDIKRKTIDQQQAKMDTYLALVIKGLPVPMDLKAEVESVLAGGTGPSAMPGEGAGGPGGPEGGAPPPGGPGGAPGGPEGPGGGGTMMPGPPPDLFGPTPGGGPPVVGPTPPGPRGNVPEVSNERRPGLTYNASRGGEVRDLDDLAERTKDLPEEWRLRAVALWTGAADEEPEHVSKTSDTLENETEDPDTWELKVGQRVEHEGDKTFIVEGSNRLSLPGPAGKRYSLIDPMAEGLEEEKPLAEDDSEQQSA